MFSFVRRIFSKKDRPEKQSVTVNADGSTKTLPYTLNFEGADEIRIVAEDCSRENVTAVARHIIRPSEVKHVIDLLEDLPTEGTAELETAPCTEHRLIAYKFDEPFATVTFYKRVLKLENGLFIANDAKAEKKQEELFRAIEVKPKIRKNTSFIH